MRRLNSIFIFFICIFYLSSCAFCSDSLNIKKYHGLSFNKNKFFQYGKSEFYIMKDRGIYKKKGTIIKKEFEFDGSFSSKGFILNDKYLIIYGLNNILAIDRKKSEVLLEKKFSEKIILKPIIYLNSLFICLDYDKVISVDLVSSKLNWQYRNDVANNHIYTNTEFIQSDNCLLYINSNRMHMINKYTGLMAGRGSVAPRHLDLTSLKNPRIKCIKLYNHILYMCYDNGILLAYHTKLLSFLWQKSSLDCKSFVIYKNYIVALKSNGQILLIKKSNGHIVARYNNELKNFNVKKIIFLRKMNRFLILGEKSMIMFRFTYRKLYFNKPILIKADDVIQSSSKSIFLISKNKSLKEYFFTK